MGTPLNCTSISSACTAIFHPTHNGVMSTWTAPPGRLITKLTLGQDGCGSFPGCPNVIGCIENVTDSSGVVIPGGTAGNCGPNAIHLTVADCSAHGGLNGFNVISGSDYDVVQPICVDGFSTATPSPPSTGGSQQIPPQTCPIATHYLSQITANTNGNDISSLTMTCSPLSQFCIGDNLNTPGCQAYCNSNVGLCDAAAHAYCSQTANFDKGVCGCALPDSQYPLIALNNSANTSIPIACDSRCQSTASIHLSNTGTCNVGTICVQSDLNISAVQSSVGKGINISQSCGNSSGGGAGGTSFFTSTTGILVIVGLVVAIIIIIIVIFIATSSGKKKNQAIQTQQKQQYYASQRTTAPARPTVIRVQ
jgi:preprotein translocase subunit SecG